jgi:uncharacterized Zn-binding protein involved in type VI secretion
MNGATRKTIDSAGGRRLTGSADVFVEVKALVRKTDKVAGHGKSKHAAPVMVKGSSTVFCNGLPACRKGDLASCGHVATGSSTVFIGN